MSPLAVISARVLAALLLLALPAAARAADTSTVHQTFGNWLATDFRDPANPGCALGSDAQAPGGRIILGLSAKRPNPTNFIVRKIGWAIPEGTAIQMRSTFPDGKTIDLAGKGKGRDAQLVLPPDGEWFAAMSGNPSVRLTFAGSEPAWDVSLDGFPKAVDAMRRCVADHRVATADQALAGAAPSAAAAGGNPQPFGGSLDGAPAPAAAPAASGCEKNWRLCRDNADVANHYRGYALGQIKCKDAATAQAKYGTPVWPGFWSGGAFTRFHTGSEWPATGVAVLVEEEAQFQNGFGAMVHSRVFCRYDLGSEKVLSAAILEKN